MKAFRQCNVKLKYNNLCSQGFLRESIPPLGCSPMKPADRDQLIVIIRNGNCTSEAKVRNAQAANYSAVIVHNVGSNDMGKWSGEKRELKMYLI